MWRQIVHSLIIQRWTLRCPVAAVALVVGGGGGGTSARADVIAHWSFDAADGQGNYPDTTGHYPAAPRDASNISVYDGAKAAPFGQAIRFGGGQGAYLTIPPLTGIQTKSFSVAVWANFATPGPSFVLTDWPSFPQAAFAFGVNPLTAGRNGAQLIADIRSVERLGGRNNSDERRQIVRQPLPDKPLSLNEWHHITWVWDRDTATFTTYVDAVSQGSVVHPTTNTSSKSIDIAENHRPMRIGSQEQVTGRAFNGALDELWVFDQALTPVPIRNLMKYNDIQGRATVAAVTPEDRPTPTPADSGSSGGTASGDDSPAGARPIQASASGHLSAGRVVGVVFGLVIVVGMACYLIWAVTERGKVRTALARR